MNFVRKGPRHLFFRTTDLPGLKRILTRVLGGKDLEFYKAIELAGEEDTIAFVTHVGLQKTRVEDAYCIVLLPFAPASILSALINKGYCIKVSKVDLGPGQIVMRVPENGDKIIEEVEKAYNAKPVSLIQGIDEGEEYDTLLTFSNAPIRRKVTSLKYVKQNLLITKPSGIIYQELRRDAIRYITHGLEKAQWYELKINIYDANNLYDHQYERLVLVLSDLEAGFILGESWTKDHAMMLLSVIAYQVRLFSFLSPNEIKKILLGLEYDSKGNRIVDLDLYYKNRKIEWINALDKEKRDRTHYGINLREELYSKLSEDTLKRVLDIEAKMTNKKL